MFKPKTNILLLLQKISDLHKGDETRCLFYS